MILPKHEKEFDLLGRRLIELMREIRKYQPEAEIFMEAESGLTLFDGLARGHGDGDAINWGKKVGKSHWTPGFGCGGA